VHSASFDDFPFKSIAKILGCSIAQTLSPLCLTREAGFFVRDLGDDVPGTQQEARTEDAGHRADSDHSTPGESNYPASVDSNKDNDLVDEDCGNRM
jgi:hypothetical protein